MEENNRIYVKNSNLLISWSRSREMGLQEVAKCNPNNTNVNKTELNNVNNNGPVYNTNDILRNLLKELEVKS
jgi:hypothetical protein